MRLVPQTRFTFENMSSKSDMLEIETFEKGIYLSRYCTFVGVEVGHKIVSFKGAETEMYFFTW